MTIINIVIYVLSSSIWMDFGSSEYRIFSPSKPRNIQILANFVEIWRILFKYAKSGKTAEICRNAICKTPGFKWWPFQYNYVVFPGQRISLELDLKLCTSLSLIFIHGLKIGMYGDEYFDLSTKVCPLQYVVIFCWILSSLRQLEFTMSYMVFKYTIWAFSIQTLVTYEYFVLEFGI